MTQAPYDQFAINSDEFRVLQLQPASLFSEPIITSLLTVKTTDRAQYVAISYTWGTQTATYPVSCNGTTLLVTRSCNDALRTLRSQDATMVWVDQLCINQTDMSERRCQVLLMNEIYAGAMFVAIWLGCVEDICEAGSERVLNLKGHSEVSIKDITERLGLAHDLVIRRFDWNEDRAAIQALYLMQYLCEWSYDAFPGAFDRPRTLPSAQSEAAVRDQTAWELVLGIFNQPYFQRRWIVQEVASNQKVSVLFGRRRIDFWWVSLSIATVSALRQGSAQEIRSKMPDVMWRLVQGFDFGLLQRVHIVQSVQKLSHSSNTGHVARQSLASLLLMCRDFKTKDPLDQVYALQAMATEKYTLPAPDYSLKCSDLLLSVVVHLIETGQGPSIVSRAGLQVKSPLDKSPTWCPSWISDDPGVKSDKPAPLLSNHYGVLRDAQNIQSSMYAAGTTTAQLSFPNSRRKLHLVGSPVDRVAAIQSDVTEDTLNDDEFERYYDWYMNFIRHYSKHEYYTPEAENMVVATFSRTDQEILHEHDTVVPQYSPEGLDLCLRILCVPQECLRTGRWHEAPELFERLQHIFVQRRFWGQLRFDENFLCATGQGFIGIGPCRMRLGDEIAIFHGFDLPMVVRRVEGNTFKLVGAAYVLGWMKGEALKLDTYRPQDMVLT